jgi:SecD/SecF fusion protein
MDQLLPPQRRRFSTFSAAVLLAAIALVATSHFAPHVLAQAAAETGVTTVDTPGAKALDDVPGRWEGAIKAALAIAPFVLAAIFGPLLAKQLRMPDYGWKFGIAIWAIMTAVIVLSMGTVKLGPDLSGGITLIYELSEDQSTAARSQPVGGEGAGEASADGGAAEGDSNPAGAPAPSVADDREGMSKADLIPLLIGVLSERIDPAGTKEISIRKYGEDQVEIIIPEAGAQELEYIERRISTAGQLMFRITASEKFSEHRPYILIANDRTLTPLTQDVVRNEEGKEIARWVEIDEKEFETKDAKGNLVDNPLAVAKARGLVTRMAGKTPQALVITDDGLNVEGRYMKSVTPDKDDLGKPQVSFAFDSQGAFLFGQLTGEHLPNPNNENQKYNLGILLDNRLLSAPSIESKITDRGRISGNMSQEEVNFLVGILKAGQLPAALNKVPISRARISPTLGAQTIEKGKTSLIISLALVALFMVYYYKWAGVIACFGLSLNMLLIVGCMVLISAAFTLPGLAGLVLTVGMSVDANVLIYERIREELKRGAALRMAIRNGFDRATTTIIDSNVTNLITGVVIYKIAPDNVKGFGITLVLGIAISIFVAVFLTRLVFDVLERKGILKTLSMREFVGVTNFDFLGWRRACIAGSLIVIGIGLAAVFARRGDLFDIDFTGGSSVQFVLKEDEAMNFDAVLAKLNETDLGHERNLSLVRIGETNTHYSVTTIDDNIQEVEDIIAKAFAGKLQTYEVTVSDYQDLPPGGATGWLPSRRAAMAWNGLPLPLGYASLLQAPPQDGAAADDETASNETPATDAANGGAAESAEPSTDDSAAPAEDAADAAEPAGAAATGGQAGDENPAPETGSFAAGGTSAKMTFASGTSSDDSGFTGGVSYDTLQQLLTDALQAAGHENVAYELTNSEFEAGTSRSFTEWQVKVALPLAETQKVLSSIESSLNAKPIFPLSNKIGGRVAAQMAASAVAAIILCLAGIIGYVWFRFHGVWYGVAAVVALIHDVLVALGFVALSAYLVQYAAPVANVFMIDKFQVGLTLVAAFLTIIGYSLNDTIVIFDRIREVKGKSPRLTADMINLAMNQTFARTLLTSFTSLISVTVLYIMGGEGIHAFAFALLVGFISGVYSTIYIANPALLWLAHRAEVSAAKAKEIRAA